MKGFVGNIKGPQGDTGATGAPGAQGPVGEAAGFTTPTATAETLAEGAKATVSVVASGEDTAKKFDFTFGIPKGEKGDTYYTFDIEDGDLYVNTVTDASPNVTHSIDPYGNMILTIE